MIAPGSLRGPAPRAALPRLIVSSHNVSDTRQHASHATTAAIPPRAASQGSYMVSAVAVVVVLLQGRAWRTQCRGKEAPTRGIRGSAGVPTFDSRNDHSLD